MSADTHRYHLSIPRAVWQELRVEAARRKVTVSRVIVEQLKQEVHDEVGHPGRGRLFEGDQGGRKWRVTVRLDSKLFERLSHEAAGVGMTRAAVAREWLRRAATTKGEKGEGEVLNTIRAPDELETVTMVEGRSVVFDF
jgi:macrodomain Ter protein organizer (MatP/YcbG family)